MSKYSTPSSPAIVFSYFSSSSSRESSYFLIILMNITSPSSSFVQINFASGGEGGFMSMFSGFPLSSSSSSDFFKKNWLFGTYRDGINRTVDME
nr:hypothetical protein [Tanacetum cinerariifolium]